ITVSAVAITLFLGGPNGPEILGLGGWSGIIWFLIKEIVFLSVYIWIRATLPRFRYDQLMDLGWKRLIPVSLYWLLLIAALRVGVCPARCIHVRGADNPPDDPVAPGERYGFVYEINYLRCIHCDLCVEACPTEAITESKLFEFSFSNRNDAIYTKTELLVDDDGRPKQLPWEDWREGDDVHTSAWVRATAPSGDANYEGRPSWS